VSKHGEKQEVAVDDFFAFFAANGLNLLFLKDRPVVRRQIEKPFLGIGHKGSVVSLPAGVEQDECDNKSCQQNVTGLLHARSLYSAASLGGSPTAFSGFSESENSSVAASDGD